MAKNTRFVLRPLSAVAAEPAKRTSQAQRDREAAAYWDSLTLAQEGWVLRKMGFHKFGQSA